MRVIPLMSAQGVFERRIWPTDELMGWGWEVCSNKACAVGDFSKKKKYNNCTEPLAFSLQCRKLHVPNDKEKTNLFSC